MSGYSLTHLKQLEAESIHIIREVVADRVYLSPRVAGIVVGDYVRRLPTRGAKPEAPQPGAEDPYASRRGAFDTLTPREREVLQLMAEGYATKEVAHRLGVSVKTVETHRRQIMEKLDMHSVAELTKYAIREGLTTLD